MDNPAECRVCFTTFSTDGNHRPRTFPCGHTLCSACITNLLRQGTRGRLTCPTCRVQHAAPNATHFPISYGMEALIQQMKSLAGQQGGSEITENQEGMDEVGDVEIEVLREKVVNALFESNAVATQVMQRQDESKAPQAMHVSLLNKLCELVMDNKRALTKLTKAQGRYQDMLVEGFGIASHLQAVIDRLDGNTSVEGRRAIMNLANSRIKEMEKWHKNYLEISASDTATVSSNEVLMDTHMELKHLAENFSCGKGGACSDGGVAGGDVSSSQVTAVLERVQHSLEHLPGRPFTLTTEDLRTLNPEVIHLLEGQMVFGVYSGASLCSLLTLENGRLHLYHLLDQPLPSHAHTFQIASYLSTPHSSVLVFLDLAWHGAVRGRVYIRLNLLVPLARQFLLLCSGQQGPSYAGTSLLKVCGLHNKGEFIMGGDYNNNDGTGGAPLLADLRGDYRRTGAAGSVWGRWDFEDHRAAQFAITTRECKGVIPRVFGSVEEGMPAVRTAVAILQNDQVTVEECGVVLIP